MNKIASELILVANMLAAGSPVAEVTKQIETVKKGLISKAKSKGIWENFGQKECRALEDGFSKKYNMYGSSEERQAFKMIMDFHEWCMDYTG